MDGSYRMEVVVVHAPVVTTNSCTVIGLGRVCRGPIVGESNAHLGQGLLIWVACRRAVVLSACVRRLSLLQLRSNDILCSQAIFDKTDQRPIP